LTVARRLWPAAAVAALALTLASFLPLAAPAAAAGCETAAPQPGEERLPAQQRALLAVARSLPLDVKMGQLLMPGFVGTMPDAGLLERAERGHVGGFFFLIRNVANADQTRTLTAQLSEAAAASSAGIRPFLGTDFEGGTVNTLRPIIGDTTSAAGMAATGGALAGTLSIPSFGSGVRRVVVAVSPLVPVTLEPADYTLEARLR
jgi:hypothetical protein